MLAVLLVGLWFLQKNAYISPLAQGHKKVAVAVDQVNQVRAKSSASLGWSSMSLGQDLYNYDQIFTHDESQVTLRFLEDSEITVQENTLLRLLDTQQGTQLDLDRGFVVASLNENSRSEKMIFSLNGRVFEISTSDKADIQIVSDGDQASVEVLKGKASLKQEGGKSYDLKQDSKASLRDDEASVEVFPIKNTRPSSGQKFYTNSRARVELSFKGAKKSDTQVHIAKDPFFRQSVERSKTQDSLYKTELAPGRYFWRVEDQNDKALGLSTYFDVVLEEPPQWISPESLRQFISLPASQQAQVELDLQWTHPDSDGYLLEVLREGEVWKSWELESPEKVLVFQLPGRYLARVKSAGPERSQAVWSKEVEFNISKQAPVTPKLLAPADKTEVYLFQETGEIKLSWERPVYAKSFELRVWGPEGLSTYQTQDHFFDLEVGSAGLYEWDVVAQTENSRSDPTPRFSFELTKNIISPSFPQDGATIELTRPKQVVDFDWKDVRKAKSYTFELSKSADFETLEMSREVRASRMKLRVPEVGVYYWRAKALGESGEVIYSRPYRVLLTPAPPPPKPDLKDDLKIEYIESRVREKESFWSVILGFFISKAQAQNETSKKIKLSWSEAPVDVKGYLLRIRDEQGEIIFEKQTSSPEVIWKKPVEGRLSWELAYIDHWDRVGPFSDPQQLEVRELYTGINELDVTSSVPQAPKAPDPEVDLVEPYHGQSLDKPETLVFKWALKNFDQEVEEVFFELCEDLSFQDLIVQRKLGSSDRQMPLLITERAFSEQSELTRYWRVRAVIKNGKDIVSKRRRLELKAYRPIQKSPPEKKIGPKTFERGFDLAYATSKLNFSQPLNDGREVDIDGTSIVGAQLSYIQGSWGYGLGLQSGEVFEGEKFRSTTLEASYHFENPLLKKIDWAVGGVVSHLSSFELSNGVLEESGLFNATLMTRFSYFSKSSFAWSWRADLLAGQAIGLRTSFKAPLWRGPYYLSLHFESLSFSEKREQGLLGVRFGRRFSWD